MSSIPVFMPKSGAAPIPLAFVELKGIHFDMEIGVAEKEIGRQQRVTIDVQVGYSDSKTRISDSQKGLLEGFDYSKVYECISKAVEPKTSLLETLASRIANLILDLDGALTCSVTVMKARVWPNVPETSITIHRTAN